MITTLIWGLLFVNAGIGFVFAWGLLRQPDRDPWRTMVRDWVGSKSVWIAALAVYWALDWIGFTERAPRAAQLLYVAVLVLFTVLHTRAAANWMTGQVMPAGSVERTVVAAERTADATERIADQGDGSVA